jgi:class 3 adenylate cyclase/streptogramin lyase
MIPLVTDVTSATATFLFTDIEGSTQLLKAHRSDYASILADHHRLLREAFEAHGGREVDNQGDSFFVAFPRARDAVLAAATAQRDIAEHSWPGDATVRVRMGIHTGEADLAADRYVGMSVHRAARISSVGHGGQVLVSPTTAGLLEDEAEIPGVAIRDLGEHRLKDIVRPVRLYQLDIEGLQTTFPALASSDPPRNLRRRRVVVAGAAVGVAVVAVSALAVLGRDQPPPEVLPNSLVRIDPATLEPTDVVPVSEAPDLVVATGGYVWMTHHILRDAGSSDVRDAGDRILTRVDPETGAVDVVGGGLAPCGLTADPSGDVWVANCFASGTGANVVRVDAATLEFEETWPVPPIAAGTFFRGLAYGGGALWLSTAGMGVTRLDPQTGARQLVPLPLPVGALAWSDGYGDLWGSSFDLGSLVRLHAASGDVSSVAGIAENPAFPVVDGDTVWGGDWAQPAVFRVSAVGQSRPRTIPLPVTVTSAESYVWSVAAGSGAVWAATPRDHAIWRIDPDTDEVVRVPIPHLPSGVATDGNGVWVTVRAE